MTETEQKAREAWKAMVVPVDVFVTAGLKPGPMPAALALDMVQDATGERQEAVTALLSAAAEWVTILQVGAALRGIPRDLTEVHTRNRDLASVLTRAIRSGVLEMADLTLETIKRTSRPAHLMSRAEARACEWWIAWEVKAALALRLAGELVATAQPAA